MKCTPAATLPNDVDITEAPFLGGEFAVYLTEQQAVKLVQVEMTSSGNGTNPPATYTARPGAAITGVGGTGADLQIVTETRLLSAVNCTVTFNVVDDLGATTTASATFAPNTRDNNQSSNFSRGTAQDLTVASGAARKIASITGLAAITGGSRGVKFAVYQCPEFSAYTLIGATTEKKFNTKSRRAVGIDAGMEGDAFVKLGKSGKGELTIDSKFFSREDGLPKFDGARCTALLVGIKEDVVTQNNFIFVKYIPAVDVNLPDGDSEAMANAASGKFKDHLFFEAP